MSEIKVLDKLPIVFTKDARFLQRIGKSRAVEGGIILLPEDAVLVIPKSAPKERK